MDSSTRVDMWEAPAPSKCIKAKLRREQMLGIAAAIKEWPGNVDMIFRSEYHVCRFLWELHHRGPIPEDHFCWSVDQVVYRWIEARAPDADIVKKAFGTLGAAPSTRMNELTDLGSTVWARYETILSDRTRVSDHTDKTTGLETGHEGS